MDRRKILTFLVAAGVCAGCHNGAVPEFPDWAGHMALASTARDPSNAFTAYARAAEEAERDGGKYLDMVSFYPGQRKAAMEKTAGAVRTLIGGTARKCDFEFEPRGPFRPPPYQRGWRLLGRDLVWMIGDAIQKQDYGAAVQAAGAATKFGFDISGGSATDASLGLAIVDEARRAIAPALDRMDASHLSSLAAEISATIESKPSLVVTIDHEHENMLMGVQAVQDAYRSNNFDEITRELGQDTRSAIDFLDSLHRKDATKRPQYFSAFAAEADSEANWIKSVAELPVAKRGSTPEPRGKADRPWRKFAKQFFGTLGPLLQMHDEAIARTRLLVLESSILSQVKQTGSAPKDLSGFKDEVKIDPYSGKQFVYGADGADYHVYSVGADLRDDGGETDETYTQPDLKLERGI